VRYSDPVNPQGYQREITNIVQLRQSGGTFDFFTPFGQKWVEFNANLVFDPDTIMYLA